MLEMGGKLKVELIFLLEFNLAVKQAFLEGIKILL